VHDTALFIPEKLANERQTMNDVFIVQQHIDGEWTILRAASGFQHYDDELDARFMTLQNGSRFIASCPERH
jgi:hypothetical protein